MDSTSKVSPFTDAIVQLQVAWTKRDDAAAVEAFRALFAQNPRKVISDATAPERAVFQQIFEGLDDILQHWWLADDERRGLWRALLLPGRTGFRWMVVTENAVWLRLAGSGVVDEAPALPAPPELAKLSFARQARALGRFCVRCDAATPLDYEAVAQALDERLRPFFALWMLRVYLVSPHLFIDEAANENRRRAMRAFAKFHDETPVDIPFHPLSGYAGYRAAYYDDEVRSFLEALVSKAMAPAFERRMQLTPRAAAASETSPERGVFLACWHRDHAVFRCMSPLAEGIRTPELRGYVLEGDGGTLLERFTPEWRSGEVDLLVEETPSNETGWSRAAQTVAADELDFLFYPEVGLTLGTRWASTQRLARVQAVGYGHPRTTGSAHMDYFVGGAAIETDPSQYTERLVLLPGLGVGTTAPPQPLVTRDRPLDDPELLVFNQSSFDKLNSPLLQAWGQLLRDNHAATLEFYPALTENGALQHGEVLGALLAGGNALLVPLVPRQKIVDRLVDADLYLDSYPFGGFNTLVEVLAAGCPVVTLEGRAAQNRFGAAMLRRLGLPEFLIARDYEQYIRAAERLIRDAKLRLEIRAMLERERVLEVLRDDEIGSHFAAAVEWMQAEGPRRSGALPPVYIEAGEAPRVLEEALPLAG